MNPDLDRLQSYPFERLRGLLAGTRPPAELPLVDLSIGEPKHPTPPLILDALAKALPGVSQYPTTAGTDALRAAIAGWLGRRFRLPRIDAATEVLPVSGTREALFAIAQAVVDRSRAPLVVAPNPFYQIYEGAALLAGAEPLLLPALEAEGFRLPLERVTAAQWPRVQLAYVCSPGNPTGRVLTLEEWRELFELSDRHGFVIAADECYSEIYGPGPAPLGALEAAARLGRDGYPRLLSFGSLSKRSSVPGLRSGYVAGDARILSRFLQYRTYHGAALGLPVQAASIAAWNDESHVEENRRLYAAKFDAVTSVVAAALPTQRPQAGFYLWARTPGDDEAYARSLYERCHVKVLPGSYLARERDGLNPGRGYVRIALVDAEPAVVDAARRIAALATAH